MAVWHKTEFKGVRYRKHPTRKHGIKFDHYYVITYKWNGKTITESIGWSSEGNKPSEAFDILRELKRNQKKGEGPCTLTEKRQLSEDKKKAAAKARAAEKLQTFKAFFDGIYLPDAKTRCKPQTTAKAEQHVKNWIHPVTGDTPMREITLVHVNRIKSNLSEARRSPRHQQYVFRTFAMIWNAAFDHGFVNAPCPTKSQSFRLPKVDNERQRYLTNNEEAKLLAEVLQKSKQAHDMALVSLDAGLRFGEIAALTWGCLDLEGGTIRVLDTKGGRDRNVPMTGRLKTMFESMVTSGAGALAFPNSDGGIQTQVPSSFKRGLDEAKLNEGVENKKMRASFHTLRHTYASRLVQSGADLYKVQRLLGHSTPVMTARYSKLADDDLRQAVKAMERGKRIQQSEGKIIHFRKKA